MRITHLNEFYIHEFYIPGSAKIVGQTHFITEDLHVFMKTHDSLQIRVHRIKKLGPLPN